jgi:hypothetical protein
MTLSSLSPVKGNPAPVLVLCRQCIEYVYEDTKTCPHCGRDAREIGSRYREEGYAAIEAMERIQRTLERRTGK